MDSSRGPAATQNGRAARKRRHEENGEDDGMELSQFHVREMDSIGLKCCSGVVERLYLRNFMCHDSLEVVFDQRINFIVGRNGSGKSAILLALVIGLGGKASATNRGNSLKEFVKKGEKSAVIEVTLHNAGLNAYKSDVFGDRITIKRTIVAAGNTGGGYKIKSASGAVVSSKREDLTRLLQALKIQVDNPVAVLNQDTSRNFLNSSNPADKYTLFMRASQLDVIVSEHAKAANKCLQVNALLNEKIAVQAQQEKTVKELRARFKALKSVPEQRRRIDIIENQIKWSDVIDKETELAAAQAAVAAAEEERQEMQLEADGSGEKEQEMKDRHKELKQELAVLRQQIAAQEARFNEAKTEYTRRREATQGAQRNVRACKQLVQRQMDNVKALKLEIQRLEQTTGPDYLARRAALRDRTTRCEEQLAQAKAAAQTSELHITQLRHNEEPLREQIHTLRGEQNEVQRRIETLQNNLNTLSQSTSTLSLYGSHAVPLQTRIDAAVARGEFSQPPVGPLGQHVKLSDGNGKWACAVEQHFAGLLNAYVVNSSQDRAKLFQLMTEVIGNRKKPTIINSRFQSRRHDTKQHQVATPRGTTALIDAVVIDNTHAFNTLVDQSKMEKVLLIPTQDMALAMMKREETVPRNCNVGILPNGDLYYPAPGFRTFAGWPKYTARYFQVSTANRIRELEARLGPEQEAFESCRSQVTVLDERLTQLRAEIRQATDERNKLKRTTQTLFTELSRLRDTEEPEIGSISTLAAEQVECEEQLAKLRDDETAAEEQLTAAMAEMEAAKRAAKVVSEEAKSLAQAEEPLIEAMERIRGDVSASVTAQNFRNDRLKEQLAKLKAAQKVVKVLQTATAVAEAEALKLSPRVELEMPLAALKEERRRLDAAVRSLEEDQGDYMAVGEEYLALNTKYEALAVEVQDMKEVLQRMNDTIRWRAEIYKRVRRMVTWIVTHYFQARLNHRKYTGEMIIDNQAGTLTIEVAPAHRNEAGSSKDTRTLSGGERSYSTVVFIMALWDAVELPFYFMDEFDVFMDSVNRQVIMDLLLEHAKQKAGRQFVFLTPQNTDAVALGGEVAIHRMEDPRV